MSESVRRGGLVGPIILIALGLIFLLNNIGLLSVNLWDVLSRMWPVLLIAWGLDLLIGRRSVWGSVLAGVLIVAVLVGGVWLTGQDLARGGNWAADTVRQPAEGLDSARLTLRQGVGSLQVDAAPEGAALVEGSIQKLGNERVLQRFTAEGSKGVFALESQANTTFMSYGRRSGPTWDLHLSRDLPLDLRFTLGVGEAELDLNRLQVDRATLEMGVGQANVQLPARDGLRLEVGGAVGAVTVVVPPEVGVRVQMQAALVNRQVPAGYQRQGDSYTSPNYGQADQQIDVVLRMAIGQATVRQGE
ncbi:MAG: hypothetical protein GX605_07855 [Chloroflexi bacterium]|nr:hypothetical protein [Chloroflexota bacterium]